MARKISNSKKIKVVKDEEQETESSRLLENRVYRFKELLGQEIEEHQLDRLVNSKVDYWDLDKLLKNGCSIDLAIDILM